MSSPAELLTLWGVVLPLIGIWVWAVIDLARAVAGAPSGMQLRLALALGFVVLTGLLTGPVYLLLRATVGFSGVGRDANVSERQPV